MSAPHQPLFVVGGVWAIVAVATVFWGSGSGLEGSPFGGLAAWHAHEMVFGFAAAMFSGYALTAMRSWPGAPAPPRGALPALISLWVLARLSAAGALSTSPSIEVPAGVAFMATVAATLGCAAFLARTAKGAFLALFALAMTALQIAAFCGSISPHMPVLAFAALLSIAGGRMVSAFTWCRSVGGLKQKRRFDASRAMGFVSGASILVAIGLDAVGAAGGFRIAALMIAAAAEALRLFLWRSTATLSDGLLLLLHLGYSWLPVGLLMVALAEFPYAMIDEVAALHALAAGAISCSIYAVASRAVARRADRLRPAPVDILGGLLLWAATVMRVFTPPGTAGHEAASVLWCAAWSVFVLHHGRAALRPSFRPAFSGPKQHAGPSGHGPRADRAG